MASILGVGVATLDVICSVDRYPEEDSKTRADSRRIARGGNAANTLVVLSQLGHRCGWAGTLGDDRDSELVVADMQRFGLTIHAERIASGSTPTSYIVASRSSGSRTIVHHRELPELNFARFEQIPLAGCDWLHFEGRNLDATERMLSRAAAQAPRASLSVEVERDRPGIERLFQRADLLVFSSEYARARGHNDPEAFLRQVYAQLGGRDLVCTWGAAGAHLIDRAGTHHAVATPALQRPIDTLGAGDTFNAGIIDALVRGRNLADAVAAACTLAARKCAHVGLDFVDQLD